MTGFKLPFPVPKPDIVTWRVWTWLALKCLLTMSSLIVITLQWKTAAQTVCNLEISTLLLDTRHFLNKTAPGLCNAVKLCKLDSACICKCGSRRHRIVTIISAQKILSCTKVFPDSICQRNLPSKRKSISEKHRQEGVFIIVFRTWLAGSSRFWVELDM